MPTLRKKVRSNAHPQARAYYLSCDGGRYPSSGGWFLEPFQEPSGAPAGSYVVGYLSRIDGGEILGPKFEGAAPIVVQIEAPAPSQKPDSILKKEKSQQSLAEMELEKLLSDPQYVHNKVEYDRHRLADLITENRQLLGNRVVLAHDNAEVLVLNRAFRSDLERTLRNQTDTVLMATQASARLLKGTEQLIEASIANTQRISAAMNSNGTKPGIMETVLQVLQAAVMLKQVMGGKGTGSAIDAFLGEPGDADSPEAKEARSLRAQIAELAKNLGAKQGAAKQEEASKSAEAATPKPEESPPKPSELEERLMKRIADLEAKLAERATVLEANQAPTPDEPGRARKESTPRKAAGSMQRVPKGSSEKGHPLRRKKR